MKARRNRQNLINKPQADAEHERDADVQLQDVEINSEPVISCNDASADNFTVTCRNQKNNAVSNQASHSLTEESYSHIPVIDKMKNCSLSATVSDVNSQSRLLMDAGNTIPVTKTLDSSVVSDQLLPRKSCSQAPKARTAECSSLMSLSDSSCHKTLSTQPVRKQLMSTDSHNKDRCGISSRSNFVGNTRKTASYMCNSESRSVQDSESSAVGHSSNAAVCASGSHLKSAETAAASHMQSISGSVDRQATGRCMSSRSMTDTAVHQMEIPDCKIVQPNLASTHQQSRVRFEGNNHH